MAAFSTTSETAHCISQFSQWLHGQGLENQAFLEDWLARGNLRYLERDEYLLRVGDHYHALFFIHSGLVRLFYSLPDGKERNKAFYTDQHLVGAVSAAITNTTATFSIQALEPSTALELDYRQFNALARQHLTLSRLQNHLLAEAFIRNEQREAMLLNGNADQRYQWLLDHEPELLARVPQHHIAAYIGVDAVSLSRLKRKRLSSGP